MTTPVTKLDSPVLIGDDTTSATGVPQQLPSFTTDANGNPASALFEIQSTSKGFLNARMTTAQVNAIANPVDGLQVYDSTAKGLKLYANGAWTGSDVGPTPTFTSISNGSGALATPSYTFTGDTDTGMWRSGVNTIDFSTNGLRQFQILPGAIGDVNYVGVQASLTTIAPGVTALGTDANIDFGIYTKGTGGLAIQPTTTAQPASAKFWNGAGTFFTKLSAGVNAANASFVLPIADASANADSTKSIVPLSSDTAGNLAFDNHLPRYSSGSMTAANFKTIFTNGIELIPAPGANLAIVIHRFALQVFFATGQYTGGGAVYLNYGLTGAGTNFATTAAGIPAAFVTGVAANSSIIQVDGTINSTTGLVIGSVANQPVALTCGSANFAGTAAGNVNWKIWYSIVATN